MHHQQWTLQVGRLAEKPVARVDAVRPGRNAQVALGVESVVVEPIHHWGAGDGGVEDVRALEDRQRREVAAEGPAGNSHPGEVHLRDGLGQRLQRRHLVVEDDAGEVIFNGALPIPTAPRGAAPVKPHHQEALVRLPLREEVLPGVGLDHVAMRPAVAIHQHR